MVRILPQRGGRSLVQQELISQRIFIKVIILWERTKGLIWARKAYDDGLIPDSKKKNNEALQKKNLIIPSFSSNKVSTKKSFVCGIIQLKVLNNFGWFANNYKWRAVTVCSTETNYDGFKMRISWLVSLTGWQISAIYNSTRISERPIKWAVPV